MMLCFGSSSGTSSSSSSLLKKSSGSSGIVSGSSSGSSCLNGKIYRCKIILLDDTELIQEIKDSHKGQDILDIVFKHLDLLETCYFGLKFIDSKGFSCWLDAQKNVIKQVKEIEPITFYFGVKFYSSDPTKLREECTRYQFFLQIKQDIQQTRLPVTNELAAQLLAYIIQSELGDYDPKIHQFGYVSEFCWIENQSLDFENKVCDLHKKLIGQIPAAVELQFLERVKWLDLYGCELHPVVAEDCHEYYLGLSPHGIIILKNKLKIGYYYWPRIEKVWRKGKFFMIKVIDKNNENKTYGFEMIDSLSSNRLFKNCKEHKEFFKLTQSGKNIGVIKQLSSSLILSSSSSSSTSAAGKTSATTASLTISSKSPIRVINSHYDFNRPNPSLIRISSRRFKRTGKPDGSENESNQIDGDILRRDELNSSSAAAVDNNANSSRWTSSTTSMVGRTLNRYNSTPSLSKNGTRDQRESNRMESGLFSKSASASPLSVRSAFVARYDYGRMNYVSPMKRNPSSNSLRRNRSSRSASSSSKNENFHHNHNRYGDSYSDISYNPNRNNRNRKNLNNFEPISSASYYHHQRKNQPKMVDWNEIKLIDHQRGNNNKQNQPHQSTGIDGHRLKPSSASANHLVASVAKNVPNVGIGTGNNNNNSNNNTKQHRRSSRNQIIRPSSKYLDDNLSESDNDNYNNDDDDYDDPYFDGPRSLTNNNNNNNLIRQSRSLNKKSTKKEPIPGPIPPPTMPRKIMANNSIAQLSSKLNRNQMIKSATNELQQQQQQRKYLIDPIRIHDDDVVGDHHHKMINYHNNNNNQLIDSTSPPNRLYYPHQESSRVLMNSNSNNHNSNHSNNNQNHHQNTSPRVTFLPSHSTAYYSDDYSSNKIHNGSNFYQIPNSNNSNNPNNNNHPMSSSSSSSMLMMMMNRNHHHHGYVNGSGTIGSNDDIRLNGGGGGHHPHLIKDSIHHSNHHLQQQQQYHHHPGTRIKNHRHNPNSSGNTNEMSTEL